MDDQFIVEGNDGKAIVNKRTGEIIGVDYRSFDSEPIFNDIVSFDVDEFKKTFGEVHDHVDILDISFTTTSGGIVTYDQFHRDMKFGWTIIVSGSYGDLIVSKNIGKVISYTPSKSGDNYKRIVSFDVEEYTKYHGELHPNIDILDISCTLKNGKIVPVNPHRRINKLS